MVWICRDCGTESATSDPVVVTSLGWSGLDGDTGICPQCAATAITEAAHPRACSSAHRHEQSLRALALSRSMVERSRGPSWDDGQVERAARRLGFAEVPCFACGAVGDPHCPNCEGVGRVWRKGSTTLPKGGLMRLAMWPEEGARR